MTQFQLYTCSILLCKTEIVDIKPTQNEYLKEIITTDELYIKLTEWKNK